jgi:serine/threonine protein kinase
MPPPENQLPARPASPVADWALEEHALPPERLRRFAEPARDRPAHIGRYVVLESLGHGGMGIVYRARHPMIQQEVALKAIIPHVVSPEAIERFLTEVRLLGRLRHDGIAQVFDADTYEAGGERHPYFTMELIEGAKPVTDYVRDTRCDFPRRLALALEAVRAVSHAHGLAIYHGDIKPRNVLVGLDGRVKVVDFGAALELAGTAGSPQAWTPGPYAAPELYEVHRAVSLAADVYGLAVLVCLLLTDHYPFEIGSAQSDGGGAGAVVPSRRLLPLRRLTTKVTRRVERVLRHALDPRPEGRYPTATPFHQDLDRAARGLTTSLERTTFFTWARDFTLEHRGPALAVGAVITTLAAGLVAASLKGLEARRERDRAEAQRARAQALAEQEQAAQKRALAAEGSTTEALNFVRKLLSSAGTDRVRDQTLDLDYLFRSADAQLPALAAQSIRAGAIGYATLGRVAASWKQFELGSNWLARASELWAMVEAQAGSSNEIRQARLERAEALNYLAWAIVGEQTHEPGLAGRARLAVPAAKEAFELLRAELGPPHTDTLCAHLDWLSMRQLAGNDTNVIEGFVDCMAVAAGQPTGVFFNSFRQAVRDSARLSLENRSAEARARVREFVDTVTPASRPRLRRRLPLSLAHTARRLERDLKLRLGVMAVFWISPEAADALWRTMIEVAEELARQELAAGDPDRKKVEEMAVALRSARSRKPNPGESPARP